MTDPQLRELILQELDYEPGVRSDHLDVTVGQGEVTLLGSVESYYQRMAAERAARRISSTRLVINELIVELPVRDQVCDPELARTIVQVLRQCSTFPRDSVRATVRNGYVTLHGTVDWHYQRRAVVSVVEQLRGVRGLCSRIWLRTAGTPPEDVRSRIVTALQRQYAPAPEHIHLELVGGRATLTGHVETGCDREEMVSAVWRAPGIIQVEDRLEVIPTAAVAA